MIEYLEGLLEQKGQEQKVLELAEEMLRHGENTPRQILVIQTSILRARAILGQCDLAITPGNIALELSRELREWDYFGISHLFLGTVYATLGQYPAACDHLRQYLGHLDRFNNAAKYQSTAWFNLGLLALKMNDPAEASRAFTMTATTSSVLKSDRWEHGVRQALVVQLLRSKELAGIPRLLALSSYYLRHHMDHKHTSSRLYHIESRAGFARETARVNRAMAIALRGLTDANGDSFHLGTLHMLVAHVAWEVGCDNQAMEHAVAARFCARQIRHSNLENEATSFLFDATTPSERHQSGGG